MLLNWYKGVGLSLISVMTIIVRQVRWLLIRPLKFLRQRILS